MARGVGDAAVLPVATGAGVLTGGQDQALAYARETRAWGPVPRTAKADRLVVTATNVRTVVIDPRRAGVTCAAKVDVKSDGPVSVVLSGCPRR